MDKARQTEWKDELLGEILRAVSVHPPLKPVLIFKGARILNLHLGNHRQSLDIDANLHYEFQRDVPEPQEQTAWFEKELTEALRNFFEDQEPVRYELESAKVVRNPPTTPHPMGWDGLVAKIKVTDQKNIGVRTLPTVDLEIAAPEKLGPNAVCDLPMNGMTIQAYALHRIAGEKMRAFLTSLPEYRDKINSPQRDVRAKDLHDLARILNARPITDEEFWKDAAHEFRLACESRYVDCEGPQTFHQNWSRTKTVYVSNPQLAAVSWEEADDALNTILGLFHSLEVFPFSFSMKA